MAVFPETLIQREGLKREKHAEPQMLEDPDPAQISPDYAEGPNKRFQLFWLCGSYCLARVYGEALSLRHFPNREKAEPHQIMSIFTSNAPYCSVL